MTTKKPIWRTSLTVFSHVMQFTLGFILGTSLIAGVAIAAGYYYFTKMSSTVPTKPVYEENKTEVAEAEPNNSTVTPSEAKAEIVEQPEIPDNAYYALVTWPQGLSLRADPSINGAKIGGIGYNAKILILEESSDKKWQKVRIPWNQQEGWVKAGNIKRVSY